MTELDNELTQEIAGIYALYGRAFEQGFTKAPSYQSKDIENFVGYDVEPTLERLVEEGLIEREYNDFLEDEVYRMKDEEVKADALMTWGVLKEEFDESTNDMLINFDEAEKLLSDRNLEYAQ